VDAFIAAADAIEAAYPNVVVEGNEGGDGRPGSFEVTTSDGYLVYSRLGNNGAVPPPDDLVAMIAGRQSATPAAASTADGPSCG
jgi:hypothetical protein